MEIKKIDIQTKNKKYATDLAMLLDKPEFLREIDRLRKKWKLTEFYEPTNFDGFMALNVQTKEAEPEDAQVRLVEFNNDINGLLKKFNRGRNFKSVIEYSLATGMVPEGIYRGCYFDVVTIGEPNNLDNPERYQYVIVMSARTEKQEVEQAYKEFDNFRKGKIDFQSMNLNADVPDDRDLIEEYHVGNIHNSADIDKFKTQKELDRTREWYWIRYGGHLNNSSQKPISYPNVLKTWTQRCPVKNKEHDTTSEWANCPYCSVDDLNIIQQAVSSYNKLLKQS